MRAVAVQVDTERGRGGRLKCLRVLLRLTSSALLIVAGCYTYQPVALAPAARTGDELRVHLTDHGTEELARYVGPRVTALDAQVVGIEPDSTLTLGVSLLHFADGTSYPFTGQAPVAVSRVFIGSVERRTFSTSRTVVASSGAVAALIAVARAALHTGHVSPGGGPGGPPPP